MRGSGIKGKLTVHTCDISQFPWLLRAWLYLQVESAIPISKVLLALVGTIEIQTVHSCYADLPERKGQRLSVIQLQAATGERATHREQEDRGCSSPVQQSGPPAEQPKTSHRSDLSSSLPVPVKYSHQPYDYKDNQKERYFNNTLGLKIGLSQDPRL